ncbi:hypothetical protein ONS95_004691 [Cadophora gregata]|uniref:uncharacterized protein n=1 Tax=Cadophora gregata TaxID=51156 RepID=UPI0026DBF9A1|nr:uncharacterized protein ONS95_004691 [Cadophora gregata]KAK0099482.1 hypothetical protein ONS96_008319 [Cadophora gregata f. sp. sojae]KAK0104396.1 hypothetical protein ONS95_004691 [Cadophora gregata]
MAPPTPKSLSHISLLYRIYFLYFEPFGAVSGTYLCIFRPQRFLSGTLPLPAYLAFSSPSPSSISARTIPLTPLHTLLLINIASLYLLFAVTEGVVLRLTRQKSIWLAVIVGMACADVGHLGAVWWVEPGRMAEFAGWNSDEWINYGTLIMGLGLRLAFLAGVGRR